MAKFSGSIAKYQITEYKRPTNNEVLATWHRVFKFTDLNISKFGLEKI